MTPNVARRGAISVILYLLAALAGAGAAMPSTARGEVTFETDATGDWAGQRQRLAEAGVAVNGQLILEGFKNFQGGIDSAHLAGASTFDVNVALDTDKLFHLPGGKFYVDLEDHAGQDPSKSLVGDLQIFDNQNSKPYLEIAELYYEQTLFNGVLRVKAGKVDANTEFSVIDDGLEFISSSAQVSPADFDFPTTPAPMPSINAFFVPADGYYASFGAYYANRSDSFGQIVDNPASTLFSNYGAYLIGETGVKWTGAPLVGNAGNFKIGAWGHTGMFTRVDGVMQDGAEGYYAIVDQTLWQPPGAGADGPGVRSFLDYGHTDKSVTPIYEHVGGGVTWTGLVPSRPVDIVGFSPQYARLSPQAELPHSYELALESFYQYQVTPWAIAEPDLQYIVNPGGKYSDALVFTLRVSVRF